MQKEKVDKELFKIRGQIAKLLEREKDLNQQQKTLEDMEYIKIIRKHGISAQELQQMIKTEKKENEAILAKKEKELNQNEEII